MVAVERTRSMTTNIYPLGGRVRCDWCRRKMESAPRRHATFYRCPSRTLVPGSPHAATHPTNVYLREDRVTPPLNRWIASLFHPANRANTVAYLVGADDTAQRDSARIQGLRRKVAAAEATMVRLERALDAGWDPVALRDQYNMAVTEKRDAEAGLSQIPTAIGPTVDEVTAIVDQIGDVGAILNQAPPEQLKALYAALDLNLMYTMESRPPMSRTTGPLVSSVSEGDPLLIPTSAHRQARPDHGLM